MPIFESYDWNAYPMASNFLDYREGDVTFDQIKAGDTLYYFDLNCSFRDSFEIKEFKATGPVRKRDNKAYINIEKMPEWEGQPKKFWKHVLNIGPLNGSRSFDFDGEIKSYNPSQIGGSSICVNDGATRVFGTNEEFVKEYVIRGMQLKMKSVEEEIAKLQASRNSLVAKINKAEGLL